MCELHATNVECASGVDDDSLIERTGRTEVKSICWRFSLRVEMIARIWERIMRLSDYICLVSRVAGQQVCNEWGSLWWFNWHNFLMIFLQQEHSVERGHITTTIQQEISLEFSWKRIPRKTKNSLEAVNQANTHWHTHIHAHRQTPPVEQINVKRNLVKWIEVIASMNLNTKRNEWPQNNRPKSKTVNSWMEMYANKMVLFLICRRPSRKNWEKEDDDKKEKTKPSTIQQWNDWTN